MNVKEKWKRTNERRGVVTSLLLSALVSLSLLPFSSSAQRGLGGRMLGGGRSGARRPARVIEALPPALQRAIEAADGLRFSGQRTVTVLKQGRPDSHEEIVMRDGSQVRIEFPKNGAYSGQVIVENGTERRHYNPATNVVRVLPARADEGLKRLQNLARAGRVIASPGERIAGYATTELLVRDRAGNPLQRLSIEPDSGMVLRRVVYDQTGLKVGGFSYSKVDLNPAPFDPALFRIDRKGVQTTTPSDTLRRLARRKGYAAVGLPESTGFRLDTVNEVRLEGVMVLRQTYIGPAGGRLSLFQLHQTVNLESLRQNAKRLHALSWTDGGITYVLVGAQNDAALARLRAAVGPK